MSAEVAQWSQMLHACLMTCMHVLIIPLYTHAPCMVPAGGAELSEALLTPAAAPAGDAGMYMPSDSRGPLANVHLNSANIDEHGFRRASFGARADGLPPAPQQQELQQQQQQAPPQQQQLQLQQPPAQQPQLQLQQHQQLLLPPFSMFDIEQISPENLVRAAAAADAASAHWGQCMVSSKAAADAMRLFNNLLLPQQPAEAAQPAAGGTGMQVTFCHPAIAVRLTCMASFFCTLCMSLSQKPFVLVYVQTVCRCSIQSPCAQQVVLTSQQVALTAEADA